MKFRVYNIFRKLNSWKKQGENDAESIIPALKPKRISCVFDESFLPKRRGIPPIPVAIPAKNFQQ